MALVGYFIGILLLRDEVKMNGLQKLRDWEP
jgi:hypothetical protein